MATGRIELDVEDRKLLEGWSRAQRVEHRLKIRSQIILKPLYSAKILRAPIPGSCCSRRVVPASNNSQSIPFGMSCALCLSLLQEPEEIIVALPVWILC